MPYEIQEGFKLVPLKVHYEIPEVEAAQSTHAQRVRSEFFKAGLYPEFKDASELNPHLIHEFDNRFITKSIDCSYHGAVTKRRISDQIADASFYGKD